MNNFVRFLKSPTGCVVVFLTLAAFAGARVYTGLTREKKDAMQMTRVEALTSPAVKNSSTREGQPFALPVQRQKRPREDDSAGSSNETHPPAAKKKPAVLPVSLFAGAPEKSLSKRYAPYGRLIPCETIVTLESSKIDTPVIGLVTEDVWHEGRLIIPAGAEVHGRAAIDRARERIAASGKWVIVWRDATALNGTELVLSGIALDRDKNDVTGEFGLGDGTAGLRGDLIKTDNLQEVKLFASTFLGGLASGLQELRSQSTATGDLIQVPLGSGRNAALQGTSDVLNAYARQIQEAIARDGFYVRVPSGKQFYLYVTETIDQGRGTRGNAKNEELWKNETPDDPPPAGTPRRL